MDIKEYRKNWEKLSKMDSSLKVNREMGRFWTLWKTIKQEPWTPEIENKFATIAYEFFEKNPRRTIVDASEYKELLGKITKVVDDNLKEACLMSGLNAIMIYPEAKVLIHLFNMRKNKNKIILDLSKENSELRKQIAEMSSYIDLLEKLFTELYKLCFQKTLKQDKKKKNK